MGRVQGAGNINFHNVSPAFCILFLESACHPKMSFRSISDGPFWWEFQLVLTGSPFKRKDKTFLKSYRFIFFLKRIMIKYLFVEVK